MIEAINETKDEMLHKNLEGAENTTDEIRAT